MYYLPVAFGVWLHVFYWGAGAAMLGMPTRWRRWWPVLVWPAGFALQSLTVWLGAYANLPGTDSYAWWLEGVPAILLLFGLRRSGRRSGRDLWRFRGLGLLMAVNLVALIWPLATATRGLTTLSLGSCDAADYGAGARVLKEFAHGDRTGFLGLTEVVRVMSADNFFDFWLRLNHFTPSALIAFNGTIFDCSPAELTSVMTIVLLIGSLPVVFWLARSSLGYSARVSTWVTAIYGFGPITWYAVVHVAMGQLLAAPAIGLLTWAGVAMWRGRMSIGRAAAFSGVLMVGYTLILGSYNFILLVCLVPSLAFAGGLAAKNGEWRRLAAWALAMGAPLVIAGLVFWERLAGLVERFLLFRAYDFGWRIPALTPEGWLGLVGNHELSPLGWTIRLPLLVVVLVATGAALWHALKHRGSRAYLMLCFTVPILAGYAYLSVRGRILGTNASYDAYKILAVFYPCLLPAVACWAAGGLSGRRSVRLLAVGGMAVVLAGNLATAWSYAKRIQHAPLTVSRELMKLQALEDQSQVGSLNMLVGDGWSRLWANALLLRIPQYFQTHTYEGRLNTPLRGAWDLVGGFIDIQLPDGASRKLSPHYSLMDTRSPYLVRARFGGGWHEPERSPKSGARWIWSKGDAWLQLDNPHTGVLRMRLRFDVRALRERELGVWVGGKSQGTVRVGVKREVMVGPEFEIAPGQTTLELHLEKTGETAREESRDLGICVYEIVLEVLPN